MRILGIDPGTRVTGYGLIDMERGKPRSVAAGVLRAPDREMAERLGVIQDELRALIAAHAPAVMAVERVFVGRNVNSALMLGQARGVALACAGSAGIAVSEYSASQIKQAVVGTGRARKEQVRHMVGILLGMDLQDQALDCTDALAVAICHGHSAPLARRTGLPAGARWSRR